MTRFPYLEQGKDRGANARPSLNSSPKPSTETTLSNSPPAKGSPSNLNLKSSTLNPKHLDNQGLGLGFMV